MTKDQSSMLNEGPMNNVQCAKRTQRSSVGPSFRRAGFSLHVPVRATLCNPKAHCAERTHGGLGRSVHRMQPHATKAPLCETNPPNSQSLSVAVLAGLISCAG